MVDRRNARFLPCATWCFDPRSLKRSGTCPCSQIGVRRWAGNRHFTRCRRCRAAHISPTPTRCRRGGWTSYATFNAPAEKLGLDTPHTWDGVKGSKSTEVRELNLEVRPLLDERSSARPPNTSRPRPRRSAVLHLHRACEHAPARSGHPDFDQTDPSRLGLYADLIAELDHRVGQIMDCLDEAGVADDTLLVFSSDNGGLIDTVPHGCSSGPFRGGFFTPRWDGSTRTAAMVRYPGTVPEGVVTQQMLSAHD
ncbi:sulfatase-like hydrolase/transferase [Candidatus Neomicrothrix sp.]|uniref:sulfatase-like hydrolase/transferase n=1 Tax=Candidatus Neomicrothrix sp. TaxID=2719034 RepID=UPI0025B982A9|nr:sulfatase-like hydrolase/transferase [Candidatus Microthrix sp.]